MTNEKEFEQELTKIMKVANEDGLYASYLIDDALKQFPLKEEQDALNALRQGIANDLRKKNISSKTKLTTLQLINFLKNKVVDYIFMFCYLELKKREDIDTFANEFQHFFNGNSFENKGYQTLIYTLLEENKIDFDYKIENQIINPKKLGSFTNNPNIKKIEKELLNFYSKDIAKYKTASQVFSAYLFENWINILLNKTINEYETIVNVAEVLLGNKPKDTLTEKELEVYKIFL